MSDKPKIHRFTNMRRLVTRLRDDLNGGGQNFVLLWLFRQILDAFLGRYQFTLPDIFGKPAAKATPPATA